MVKIMHNKPIIGIVTRPILDEEVNVCHLSIAEDYRKAIVLSGGIPVGILPPQIVDYENKLPKEIDRMTQEEKEVLMNEINMCDGILMPGGTKRYEYDKFITNYCLEKDIPILGICLGMQLLATHIHHDTLELTDTNLTHAKPGEDRVHTVKLDKNSKLFNIIGEEEFYVNSRHRYKVTDIGDFTVVGFSDDIIEAIELKNKKFAIGVQWHPENLMNTNPSQKLFKAFINACRK